MEIYRELGERIEGAFEREGRKLELFPRIAADALREARIPERSSADEVLSWVFGAAALPAQNDLAEAFGEPPITVYRGRDFHVEVLFWLSTVTTVHGHGFSGAFQALSGERLQTRHSFEPHTDTDGPVMLGELRFEGAELLGRGDVVEINRRLVHAIVHLAEPSATIVVRTASDPDAGPQLDYRAPWLAVDPFFLDEARSRKIQALRLLCRVRPEDALRQAAALAERCDLATCVDVLDLLFRHFRTEAELSDVVDSARALHGEEKVSKLLDVMREGRRLRAAHVLRARALSPDQRLLAALLHHVPSREQMWPLLSARSPGQDVVSRAEAVLASMSGVATLGVDLDDPLTRALTFAMLRADTARAALDELSAVFDPEEVQARSDALLRHAAKIRTTVLAPILRSSMPERATRGEGGAS